MAKEKNKKGSFAVAILAVLVAAGTYAANHYKLFESKTWDKLLGKSSSVNGEAQVHFIDVGQGDCSLIVSGDTAVLIDTGESENGEKILEYLDNHDISDIDCFLLTHPHSDHMGAASYIIDNINVKQVIIPKVSDDMTPTTKFYEKFLKSVKAKDLKITAAKPGLTVDIGEGEMEIISPVQDYDDLNNYSAASIFTYGDSSFMFTGDIEKKAEKHILKEGYLEDVDVLKVAHHGSNSSSCNDFLEVVRPDYAVIQCDGVSYNHPHEDAVERILEYTDKIYRNDMDGTVVFSVTENGLSVDTEK